MHSVTVLLVTAILLLFAYFLLRSPALNRNGKPIRRSLDQVPFIGNGLIFLQPREKLFAWFVKCERHFGFETFQISVPTLPPGVVINDPKNLEYVLKNEGIFGKGAFVKTRVWDLFGNGIINADGELWKVQRKAGVNFLSNANLKILTETALPAYLKEATNFLGSLGSDDVTDLSAIFHELTTRLFGRTAYNMEMHHSDPFTVAFDYASGITGERFQNPLWKITEVLTGGKLRRSLAQVKSFGTEIIAKAVGARENRTAESKDANPVSPKTFEGVAGSLINSLLDTIDDHEMVADAALNFLTAGRDTTAQALTWLFYLLMRNPDVVDAVRTEIDDVARTALNIDGPLSAAKIDHFNTAQLQPSKHPYIMAIFYEALRLYPVIPFEFKQCVKATTLPDGTFLPEKTVLLWCAWAMNRSKLIWGEDTDDFKPERWLENGKFIAKTAFEFPVFNGGPRLCLGKTLAEGVAVQAIGTFLLRFDFKPLNDKERVSKNSLTLPMEGGLPCTVRIRNF